MKKLVLFLLVLFCFENMQAQKWAPIGTKWNYTHFEAFSSGQWPSEWKVVDTITIKGKLCSIIQNSIDIFDTNSRRNHTMITYEDSDIVYWYRPVLHDFTVLYDFNKKVGESWDIRGLQPIFPSTDTTVCSIKMTVTKVGIDTINGIPLKTMLTECTPKASSSFGGKIIQYIGNLSNIRPNPDFACKPITESWDYYGLRCFDNSFIGFHDFQIVPYCDYTATGIAELKNENSVSITPNPFIDLLTIKSTQSATISIMNLLGQSVYHNTIQNSSPMHINTASWTSGVYWYSIRLQNQYISYGKLIKQ